MAAFQSRIKKGRLKIEDIDLVRDDVIRYNLMLWLCKKLVDELHDDEGFLSRGGPDCTMENMEFVENDLDDKELRELYTYIVRVSGVTLDEFDHFYKHFEDYDILVDAYKGLIQSEQLTMNVIEDYRHDLEKYNLMEMAYRKSIIPGGYLTMDNIGQAREDLEKYELMSEAYEEMIHNRGRLTEDDMEVARKELERYKLMTKKPTSRS